MVFFVVEVDLIVTQKFRKKERMIIMIQPMIFNKAGTILLKKYDNCGRVRTDEKAYFRHGDLVSVQPNSSDTTQTVESGNSIYPVMKKVTAKDQTLALTFNTLDPEMEAYVYDRTIREEEDSIMKDINYGVTIPDTSPFTVKLPHKVKTPTDAQVVDISNNEYEYTASDPETNQFSISDDELSFASADAGKSAFITYDWAAPTAFVEDSKANETSAIMQLEHSTEAVAEINKELYDVYMVYDRVEVTEYGTPLIGKTPGTRQVTFSVLKPRGNNPPVRTKYVPRAGLCE